MKSSNEKIILDVASKHFVSKGYAATRTQQIADEAGVNKALIHYYFRSKEKLYGEVVKHTVGKIWANFSDAMSSEGSFWERTENLVGGYIDTIMENPDIPLFIMSELSQNKERFLAEITKQDSFQLTMQSYLQEMMMEMASGKIKNIAPIHLLLNLLGMTAFPFLAKPVFTALLKIEDKEFNELMTERKEVIMMFLKGALLIGK